MRTDPKTLLRGLAKFAAVVVVAGLVGAGLGIALAKLSGNDGGATQALPAPVTATTAAPATTTAATTTAPAAAGSDDQPPRVEVLSALLGRTSDSSGRALVAARVRVTNRGQRPLAIEAPALLSGEDEVALNESADGSPNPLITSVEPGASVSGTVRFTLSPEITQRLNANPGARLRIANRTVELRLTKETP